MRNHRTWAIFALFLLCNNCFIYSASVNFIKETPEVSSVIIIEKNTDKPVCTTATCKEAASDMLKKIDFNVDPCNNFYEFACGNYIKNTEIPEDKSTVGLIVQLTDKVDDELKEIVGEAIHPEDIPPFVLTKQLYKACMSENIIKQRGLTPVTNILNKLGGWPVLEKDKWNEKEFIWHKALVDIAALGISSEPIISISFSEDPKNNTKHIFTISQATINVDRDYFIEGLENEVVKAYFKYMVNVAVAMGANEEDAKQELKEILLFEMKLAQFSLTTEEKQNYTALYNPISIKEIQKIHPTIPLLHIVNGMISSFKNLTDDDIINNSAPRYLTEVEKLLRDTPKRVLANYIIWHTVQATITFLSADYRKFQFDFSSVTGGVTVQESRETQCFDVVKEKLSLAVGALYARKFFRRDSKSEAADLAKNIQLEFKYMLENIDWMGKETKQSALEKIEALYAHIAYPEELMDDNNLIDYYNNLQIDENMYLESLLNISLFADFKGLQGIDKPINKTHWTKHSEIVEVNAYFAPDNSIEFPAAILQGGFFSTDRPKYMNYGGIGFVIGHEITHGFDNEGRQRDKNGNVVDWWDPATNDAYVKKAQCIINQCGNYTIGDLTLNGVNTIGENIADNGGAKYAYRAYNRWAATHDPEPSLPGLNFNPRQMFWVSMASSWCSKYRPAYLKNLVTTNEHAPAEFRMNGVFSNLEEFANDFGCPKGSPMNPDLKCKVW